ncbi:interleukin-17 receptor C-like isoform X1 [Mobula hypostoma]|uniref:interleukin-17 receptor C-like isoform X1 n=1 Tax=Mobula hypostoma TaxID=723540 RepID=UPI002FC30147
MMRFYLCYVLWLSGVHSVEKFQGPLYEVTCPQEGTSCEAVSDCGSENVGGYMLQLLPINLTSSTILYCEQNISCFPCISIELTASLSASEINRSFGGNASGFRKSNSIDTDEGSREEDDNEVSGWIRISVHQPEGGINTCVQLKIQFTDYNTLSMSTSVATVKLSCFKAAMSSEVLVKAFTILENKTLEHTHKVEDCTRKDFRENIEWCKVPEINMTLEKELQRAVFNIPQNYSTRFIYDVSASFESKNPPDSIRLNKTNIYLNFSDIVPCLCMETWSATIEDARRRKTCPFTKEEEFQENIWRLSSLAVEYKGDALQWTLSSPCNLSGDILLCSKSEDGEACQAIPHSRQNIQVNGLREFRSVDPHPSLCVKVLSGNHVNLSCPFGSDSLPLWRLESKIKQNIATVNIIHERNQMNFSICIKKRNKCEHFLQEIQQINQWMKQIDFISQDCLQVWRSDVNFSPRITLCPFEIYARVRWTLLIVLLLILAIVMIAILMVKKVLLKGCTKMIKYDYNVTTPGIRDGVLLLYSADHSQFEKLVNTFASALANVNVEVVVDLWKRREISIQGPLPWFHSQQIKISKEGGKIIILFSKDASIKCNELLNSTGNPETLHDPYDGFMASLNCVLPDITKGNISGKYVVAYFEDLLNRSCIPEIFNKMPIYSLPSQISEFLQEIGLPTKHISEQKKYGCLTTISRSLKDGIKECQRWEKSHSV